jgi:hypothetical protein
MPTIRIGYSSDFSINSNGVGIGTTFAAANTKLDVVGALKGDFNVTGVTTLAAYGGFVAQQQHVNKSTTIGFATVGLQTAGVSTSVQYYETETGFTDLGGVHHGDDQYFNTLSEDLVIDDGQILNITNTDMVGVTTIGEYDPHSHSSYVCAGSLEQVSVTEHFSVPNGGTNDRQETPIEGTVRFNTDLNTLEFFNGVEWRQFTYNQGQSGRGVFMGGQTLNPTHDLSSMEYINISSLGNGVNFGEMSEDKQYTAGASSSTRGLIAGGFHPGASPSSVVDTIEYITIASAGGSIDFGNLSDARGELDGCGSSTRGLFMGGEDIPFANMNVIDYVEFATLGNALDFGDITVTRRDPTCLSSPTRGFCAGGVQHPASPSRVTTIDVVTIASKGNAIKFGDLTEEKAMGNGGCSNSVRGLFGGGSPGPFDAIDYITMASNGNAIVFGELTIARNNISAVSTQIRGVFGSGFDSPSTITDTIDYVTIASTGDAVDFGDMSIARGQNSAVSDSHGGLGGF